MSELKKKITLLLGAAALLGGCGATGWGQKSSGGTHTLTGGAEAAPTSEATPQPARPRGDTGTGTGTQGGTRGGTSGGMQGGTPAGGDTTTGGAEAMPTTEGTPQGTGGTAPGTGGSGPGATQTPRQ